MMRRLFLSLLGAGLFAASAAAAQPARDAQIREAVARSLPLLAKANTGFNKVSTCVSCHSQIQPLAAFQAARAKGVPGDYASIEELTRLIRAELDLRRDRILVHGAIVGSHTALSKIASAFAATGAGPSTGTDAAVVYLLGKQDPDGSWRPVSVRGASGESAFATTAAAVRTLQAYAPPALRPEAEKRVARARVWLLSHRGREGEALTGRLSGLVWAKAPPAAVASARAELVAAQRADGGFEQAPGWGSDAYATAGALLALHDSGTPASDRAYRRGVDYLLRTQAMDGSWFVKSRALPIQPPIDSGFPYGRDQWISASATALATTALAYALPAQRVASARP